MALPFSQREEEGREREEGERKERGGKRERERGERAKEREGGFYVRGTNRKR